MANSLVRCNRIRENSRLSSFISASLTLVPSPCRPTPPPPPAPLSSLGSRPAAAGHLYRQPSHLPFLNRSPFHALSLGYCRLPELSAQIREVSTRADGWELGQGGGSGLRETEPTTVGAGASCGSSSFDPPGAKHDLRSSFRPSLNHPLPVSASPRFPPAPLSGHDHGCASPPPRP